MSSDIERWEPPNDATAFESLCLDLWKDIWQDSGAQKNGRRGQAQAGVDVFGREQGQLVGVQCKQKDGRLWSKVTEAELEAEVQAARRFKPKLTKFILATTAPRDTALQQVANNLTEQYRHQKLFSVEVWAWEDLWHELYRRYDLLSRIYHVYWPLRASLPPPPPSFSDLVRDARPYLEYLAAQCQDLPLRGLDPKASDPRLKGKISLDAVYIGLETNTLRTEPATAPHRLHDPAAFPNAPTEPEEEPRSLSALEVVSQNSRLVLLGDPGSGKSTFLNHLSLCLANHHLHSDSGWLERLPTWPAQLATLIPITVTLRFFVRDLIEGLRQRVLSRLNDPERKAAEGLELDDFVLQFRRDLPPPNARLLWDFLCKTLDGNVAGPCVAALQAALAHPAGHSLVFLDGLDEVPTDEIRELVRDTVLDFTRWHPHARLVVTCRVLSYQQRQWRLLNLPEANLTPFRDDQVQSFIARWYEAHVSAGFPADEAQRRQADLERALPERPELRELAHNPMMLTVMALLHTYHGRLPEHRALLYQSVVELLLHRWDDVQQSDNLIGMQQLLRQAGADGNDLQRALWRVAYEAHTEGRRAAGDATADLSRHTLHQALRFLSRGSYDWAEKAIETIQERAGLLVAKSTHVFSFPHRSFQEYLASAHLADDADFQATAASLVDDSGYWREVIKWSAGRVTHVLNRPKEAILLLNELCPDEQPPTTFPWHRIWLAAEVLSEMRKEKATQSEAGKAAVGRVLRLLTKLIEHAAALTPVERAKVGILLGQLGDDRPGVGTRPRNRQKPQPDLAWTGVIEPGGFIMGGKIPPWQDELQFKHRLQHPFRVAIYPVTVAQFELFIQADGYAREDLWTKAGWQWREHEEWTRPEDYAFAFQTPNHPRVGVSWYEAMAFCQWLNLAFTPGDFGLPEKWQVRLPTEAEWERAARHTDGRDFPWDAKALAEPGTHCNCAETALSQTSAVGLFPSGKAVCGTHDMAGNVWEWCLTKWRAGYEDYETEVDHDREGDSARGLRGGAWNLVADRARCAYRDWYYPGFRGSLIGFRVVASPFFPLNSGSSELREWPRNSLGVRR